MVPRVHWALTQPRPTGHLDHDYSLRQHWDLLQTTKAGLQPHCSTSFPLHWAWRTWQWLALLLQNDQAKTNQVSTSFWLQAALHVTVYCTSNEKKQELPLGSPRKASSWNCCREDSCTNNFSVQKNMICRATCLAPELKDKAGCGNCLPSWPWTQNHILSGMTHCFFLFA